jgi:hypothetical protein
VNAVDAKCGGYAHDRSTGTTSEVLHEGDVNNHASSGVHKCVQVGVVD